MKTEIKQTLRDLRGAVLLGRTDAVDIALDGLMMLPGVSANDRMSDGFIEKVVLPVGEVLSGMPSQLLRPLLIHKLAVGRAVGAAAMAHWFVKGSNISPKDLQHPGSDPRSDVRQSLGRALCFASTSDPEKIYHLGVAWLTQTNPKLRHSALIFLPALAERHASGIINLLALLDEDDDREVKAALVNALCAFGMNYAEAVLDVLSEWSKKTRPNSWVICRSLSAAWAANYPSKVESILMNIQSQTGDSSQITSALKALKRHGIDIELKS